MISGLSCKLLCGHVPMVTSHSQDTELGWKPARLSYILIRFVMKPVALVSMPALSARFPSFQLALLKPMLEREGIPAQTFSLFMYFGSRIGWKVNEAIADVWPSMVGEWIWSKAAFGEECVTRDEDYFREY